MANTELGWKKQLLVQMFSALIQSTSLYAGFAWMPCAAKSNLQKLNIALNRSLRMVTGQLLATPVEAQRLECGLSSLETEMNRLIVRAAEKARRLDFEATTTSRMDREKWRKVANHLGRQLPQDIQPSADIQYYQFEL